MVANLHPPKRGPLCLCRFRPSAYGDLRAIRVSDFRALATWSCALRWIGRGLDRSSQGLPPGTHVWAVPCSSCSGLDRGPLMDVGPQHARDLGLRAEVDCTEASKSATPRSSDIRSLGSEVYRIDGGHHLELVRAGAGLPDAAVELLLTEDGDAERTHGKPNRLLSLLGRRANHAPIDAFLPLPRLRPSHPIPPSPSYPSRGSNISPSGGLTWITPPVSHSL
jgi:hypothetical protein